MALNLLVKEWSARGIDIWLRSEVTVFLQPQTQKYSLGTGYATTSYVETTLSADEAAVLDLALRDEQAVERIAMEVRKISNGQHMLRLDGEFQPARFQESPAQQAWLHVEIGPVQGGFDHQLPEAGHAEHRGVIRVFQHRAQAGE